MIEKKLKMGEICNLEILDDEKTKIVKGFYLGKKYFYQDEEDEILDFRTAEKMGYPNKELFYLFAYKEKDEIGIEVSVSEPERKNGCYELIETGHLDLDLFLSDYEIKYLNESLNKRIKHWSKN